MAQSMATRYGSKLLATSKPSLAPSMKLSYTATLRSAPTTRNIRIKPNRVRLPSSDDSAASAVALMPASRAMKPPSSSAVGIR